MDSLTPKAISHVQLNIILFLSKIQMKNFHLFVLTGKIKFSA